MWIGTSLGPCAGCGGWSGAALCPRCGRARTRRRVALSEGAADGRWILAWDGRPDELSAHLAQVEAPNQGALARVEAAQHVLAAWRASPSVRLHLDLRPVGAGYLVGSARRGHFQHHRWLLPWLVVVGGEHELRVTRFAHAKVQRRFDAGQLISQAAESQLDELTVVGPGGAQRRPLPDAQALAGLRVTLDPLVPPPRPLPPTAPEAGAAERAALGRGVWGSLAVWCLAPLLLWALWGGRASPEVAPWVAALGGRPRAEVVKQVLALPPQQAQAVARRACLGQGPWQRRHGAILVATLLESAERLRYLAYLSRHDPAPEVRLLVVELLGDEGDAGATLLARLHQDVATPLPVRQQAHRRLMDLGDPRALELAQAGLDRGREPGLYRTWSRALVLAPDEDLRRWRDHSDPHVRATARWALSRRN